MARRDRLLGHYDGHHLCIVGANETDMAAAINRRREIEGGFAVAEGGKVIAETAGLMSPKSVEEVCEGLVPLGSAAKGLGVTLAELPCGSPSCCR